MLVVRYFYSQVKNNSYFLIGLCVGLIVTLNFASLDDDLLCNGSNVYANIKEEVISQSPTTDEYEPRLNLQNKPLRPKKEAQILQRPRYYSTELGIREKLFIGVLTSEARINFQATAINKTLAHLANKIKFFITASVVKNNLNLTNIVGFTDTREILKPFHVLKYISDNYLEEFDYFYLISDSGFVNGRRLLEVVNGISVSEDVYLGSTPEIDSHYCSLEAGMLISNSVIRKVKENLDWCVRNSYSPEYSENIGRCVLHSTGLRCTQTLQEQSLKSFKLPNDWQLSRDLKTVIERNNEFDNAVSVYPLTKYADFYILQLYFARLHLESTQEQMSALAQALTKAGAPWPAGAREDPTLPAPPPPDRFHQPVYTAITVNASLMPNDFSNMLPHSHADKKDIDYIINAATLKVQNENPNLKYHSLVNGCKRFDPSRGMNYILDINFRDSADATNQNGELVLKRMEVFKPLGKAAVLPVPYVTENTRIVMVIPVSERETAAGLEFIKHYETACMERKDKVYLLLILLYSSDTPSKGPDDLFGSLKTLSLDLSQKYRLEGLKIGWVSIRLPASAESGPGRLLSIAVCDQALRKVPPESLILIGRPHMEIKPDFLNRVRMNTIQGYQVFSVMGFQRYHPTLASGMAPSKMAGRFAPWDYTVTSFYSRDYINVRIAVQDRYPIVRSDKDIETLFSRAEADISSLFELFVKYSPDLHTFRAVEPGLVFKYDELLYCPLESSVRNSTTNPSAEAGVQFGHAVLTNKCINTLAKDNFVSVTIGERSQMAKLIFEAGS